MGLTYIAGAIMRNYISIWLSMACWMLVGNLTSVVTGEPTDDLPVLTSQMLRINYAKPEMLKGENLTGRLWYRLNGGHWQKGMTFQAGEPVEFKADAEGVYDFLVEFGTDPEAVKPVDETGGFSCFVDYTKPLLQLVDVRYGSGKFLVQWKAYDANLSLRPVEIYLINERENKSILLGKFANNGAAVVTVDTKMLPGKIKVVVVDRAGNSASEITKTEYSNPEELAKKAEIPVTEKPVSSRPAASQPVVKDDDTEIQIPPAKHAVKIGDVKTAVREYKTGMEYEYRGQKDMAILHFKRSIDEAPEFVPAYIELGVVLNSMQRYEEAGTYFLNALSWDSKSVRAWKGLAFAKSKMGMHRQARNCLQKVIAYDQKDVEGYLLLGDVCWTIGNRQEAKEAWNHAKNLVGENEPEETKKAVESRIQMIGEN